jgi:hypothetical protein
MLLLDMLWPCLSIADREISIYPNQRNIFHQRPVIEPSSDEPEPLGEGGNGDECDVSARVADLATRLQTPQSGRVAHPSIVFKLESYFESQVSKTRPGPPAKLNSLKIADATGTIPENGGFAIQWAQIEAFLEGEDVKPTREQSKTPLSPSDIADIARLVTVSVDCAQ